VEFEIAAFSLFLLYGLFPLLKPNWRQAFTRFPVIEPSQFVALEAAGHVAHRAPARRPPAHPACAKRRHLRQWER